MRRRLAAVLQLACLLACVWFASPAHAGGGPENVLLVVNEDSWASMAVANEYVKLRRIPASHVLYLRRLPAMDYIAIEDFRALILQPILSCIRDRGLNEQIDIIIYSTDIPTGIWAKGEFPWGKMPRHFQDMGSLTSATYLYQTILSEDVSQYISLDNNYYFRNVTCWKRDVPWSDEDKEKRAALSELMKRQGGLQRELRAKRKAKASEEELAKLEAEIKSLWPQCLPLLEALSATHPQAGLQYDLACCLARVGKLDEAEAALKRAMAAGWWDYRHAQRDEDLKPLRDRETFKAILAEMKSPEFDVEPSQAFRHAYRWSREGKRVAGEAGVHYFLSTVLPYTSGQGMSLEEALINLRQTVAADGTKPKGTVYFMKNENVRSTTREWGFVRTAEALRGLGVQAEILDGVLPKDKEDVIGAVVGTARFDWTKCGSTIRPGAIMEHLTSVGGRLWGSGQTICTEFLRYGAAGSSGTVSEPYAIQAKFPLPWIQVHYVRGCSLAESFYQSVAGPFQLIVVGDALCQPWAEFPTVTLNGLKAYAAVKGTVRLTPGVKGDEAIRTYWFCVDGRRLGVCKPGQSFGLDTSALDDGYHELRVVAIRDDPIETQGQLLMPFVVQNRGLSVALTVEQAEAVPWNRTITARAECQGASEIALLHNQRLLGVVEGPAGTVRIDATRLGLGPVRLQALGVCADAKVMSSPVIVTIERGPGLAPCELPPSADLKDGFVLHQPGEEPKVIQNMHGLRVQHDRKEREFLKKRASQIEAETKWFAANAEMLKAQKEWVEKRQQELEEEAKRIEARLQQLDQQFEWARKEPEWLMAAGVEPGRPFTIEGYVHVDTADVYQFQLRTNLLVTMKLDDKDIRLLDGPLWRLIPVCLQPGWHRLKLVARGDTVPQLDLRFGGPGARSLDGGRFKHVAKEGAQK